MPLVSSKDVLAIAAVIDIAVHARSRPVSATLAARRKLLPRQLEPVLQALVREGILKGVRGPHGGYALARDHNKRFTAEDILRAAGSPDDNEVPLSVSSLVNDVVRPALADAEPSFSAALRRISSEDLPRAAERQK